MQVENHVSNHQPSNFLIEVQTIVRGNLVWKLGRFVFFSLYQRWIRLSNNNLTTLTLTAEFYQKPKQSKEITNRLKMALIIGMKVELAIRWEMVRNTTKSCRQC